MKRDFLCLSLVFRIREDGGASRQPQDSPLVAERVRFRAFGGEEAPPKQADYEPKKTRYNKSKDGLGRRRNTSVIAIRSSGRSPKLVDRTQGWMLNMTMIASRNVQR